MRLPSVDFEMMYWRIRRRFQRIRYAYRFAMSDARAQAHLDFLCLFGRIPAAPEPEDTFVFRSILVIVTVMALGLLAVEAAGEAKVNAVIVAVKSAADPVPERAVLRRDLSADTEALQHMKRPGA